MLSLDKYIKDRIEQYTSQFNQYHELNQSVIARSERNSDGCGITYTIELIFTSRIDTEDYGPVLSVGINTIEVPNKVRICMEVFRSIGPIMKSEEILIDEDCISFDNILASKMDLFKEELFSVLQHHYL